MADQAEIQQAVKAFILEEFLPGEDPNELTPDTELIASGVLDSVATLRLVTFLEERFGVQVEAHEAEARAHEERQVLGQLRQPTGAALPAHREPVDRDRVLDRRARRVPGALLADDVDFVPTRQQGPRLALHADVGPMVLDDHAVSPRSPAPGRWLRHGLPSDGGFDGAPVAPLGAMHGTRAPARFPHPAMLSP